jgi:uncharacterized protein YndB with AHSA1/START domain
MKTTMRRSLLACVASGAPIVAAANPADRVLRTELTVAAPLAEAWKAWTTEDGVKSFFAPGCHIEPKVDGAYEIFFNPQGEPGLRGAEGMRILAFEPERRLAFTWNAPPTIPAIRGQRTMVEVAFASLDAQHTRIRFTHLGWGEGADWDAAYAYFDTAWNTFVLPHLVHRFTSGPIDWGKRPTMAPVAKTLKVDLAAR